jgi:uncharacterized protein YjbK
VEEFNNPNLLMQQVLEVMIKELDHPISILKNNWYLDMEDFPLMKKVYTPVDLSVFNREFTIMET